MPTAPIWIKSKEPWTATRRSINPSGNTAWMTLPKSSGAANDPDGEWIDVIVSENTGLSQRDGYIDVASGGETISVSITQPPCSEPSMIMNLVNGSNNLTNNGNNLVSVL